MRAESTVRDVNSINKQKKKQQYEIPWYPIGAIANSADNSDSIGSFLVWFLSEFKSKVLAMYPNVFGIIFLELD